MKVGIVGAGIMGRLLSWRLAKQGVNTTLFDKDQFNLGRANGQAAAYTAAGMLTPLSEADSAEAPIVKMGLHALKLWPSYLSEIRQPVDFHQRGSLILAHPNDRADLQHFRHHVERLDIGRERLKHLDASELGQFEPELADRFQEGTFIQDEAWLSPQALMEALALELEGSSVQVVEKTTVQKLEPHRVLCKDRSWAFDLVIDCRGLGAKTEIKGLRGVRGEVFLLHAPEVRLNHLVRLMHPRYRLYVVPREDRHYVIGATQIESSSDAPMSVRSALELLSAAYAVHPSFGEATIVHSRVNCRPALHDNLPKIYTQPGLMQINGLFRHGFLLAPTIVEQALACIVKGDKAEKFWPELVQDKSPAMAH